MIALTMIAIAAIVLTIAAYQFLLDPRPTQPGPPSFSVTYHITRYSNYKDSCHLGTDAYSSVAPIDEARKALRLLREAGMNKLVFTGGEPFLYAKELGLLVDFAKQDLALDSISIISDGILITEEWIKAHGKCLDVLALFCDRSDEFANAEVETYQTTHEDTYTRAEKLKTIAAWCKKYGVFLELSTLVCRYNWHDDMNDLISDVQPARWQCIQVSSSGREGAILGPPRDAISDEEFGEFCARHSHNACFMTGPGRMTSVHNLILDENLKFMDHDSNTQSACCRRMEDSVSSALESICHYRSRCVERRANGISSEDTAIRETPSHQPNDEFSTFMEWLEGFEVTKSEMGSSLTSQRVLDNREELDTGDEGNTADGDRKTDGCGREIADDDIFHGMLQLLQRANGEGDTSSARGESSARERL